MAINQGVRQGPPTSADISAPPPTQRYKPEAPLPPRSQTAKTVEPQSPEDSTQLSPPSICKLATAARGRENPFFANTSPDAIVHIHLLQRSQRGYANER